MHYWGDDWFKAHGDNLYAAIEELDRIFWRHRIACLTKEKFGTRREDMLSLWDGSWYRIIYGPKLYFSPAKYYKCMPIRHFVEFMHNLVYHIDHRLVPYKKTKYGWLWGGLADFHRIIGLTKLVHKLQARAYNKAFQLVCKKYPDVIDELIMDAEGYKMIKPCKWGDIDGQAIHNKYWKTLSDMDIENEMNLWKSMCSDKKEDNETE